MKANHAGQKNKRIIKALLRLEEQLRTGVKPWKFDGSEEYANALVERDKKFATVGKPLTKPLSEKDVKRIHKEINILTDKIVPEEVALRHKPKKYRGPVKI